ncbi:MAG: chemotaxis response regulator protein-glutamate methylesterase [Steroidobacteraceae bacterium]|jgi:two-component system chemotaxis response regulator CheB|nr:chemotaxis response regulator protein-glutamate methylesterase [Steroidobacteraceae bacterium]
MTRQKIRVLIVDDSPVDRELLLAILEGQPDLEVVGQAADSLEAREKVRTLSPDVLTLDVSMPGMSGLKFLRNLMRLRPMPVVMCSSLTEDGAEATLEALTLGAVDFMPKPGTSGLPLDEYRDALVSKVRAAAYARVRPYVPAGPPAAAEPRPASSPQARVPAGTASSAAPARTHADEQPPVPAVPASARAVDVVAIGASTGGVSAIQALLESLPAGRLPPIVITQHIPAGFSRKFAERLDAQLPHAVLEAEDGLRLETGRVYVAPGGLQFAIGRDAEGYCCRVEAGERVNLHRPSVDVLFHSVARHAAQRAVGVMLTGMGADGAQGMRAMRDQGAYNIVQDKASSLVWGMPGAAAELGAAHVQLPLSRIGPLLCQVTGVEPAGPRD